MIMSALALNLNPLGPLTHEAFYQLCEANPDIKFERTAEGELIIMSPTGGETGERNSEINYQLRRWTKQNKQGKCFDSSTCFQLPNGAERSGDSSWVQLERWESLSVEERQTFPPLAPDFVVELRSPSDRLKKLQDKMQEYINNGVRLGWLIDPQNKRVEIYRPGQAVKVLDFPQSLSGEDVLPGFVLDLSEIF